MDSKNKDLIYSCSGCSSAAQTANTVAVRIDRQGLAEMSCIAGVGGDVPSLVRTAKSGIQHGPVDEQKAEEIFFMIATILKGETL
jgi:uncharacterized metal-binding protein